MKILSQHVMIIWVVILNFSKIIYQNIEFSEEEKFQKNHLMK